MWRGRRGFVSRANGASRGKGSPNLGHRIGQALICGFASFCGPLYLRASSRRVDGHGIARKLLCHYRWDDVDELFPSPRDAHPWSPCPHQQTLAGSAADASHPSWHRHSGLDGTNQPPPRPASCSRWASNAAPRPRRPSPWRALEATQPYRGASERGPSEDRARSQTCAYAHPIKVAFGMMCVCPSQRFGCPERPAMTEETIPRAAFLLRRSPGICPAAAQRTEPRPRSQERHLAHRTAPVRRHMRPLKDIGVLAGIGQPRGEPYFIGRSIHHSPSLLEVDVAYNWPSKTAPLIVQSCGLDSANVASVEGSFQSHCTHAGILPFAPSSAVLQRKDAAENGSVDAKRGCQPLHASQSASRRPLAPQGLGRVARRHHVSTAVPGLLLDQPRERQAAQATVQGCAAPRHADGPGRVLSHGGLRHRQAPAARAGGRQGPGQHHPQRPAGLRLRSHRAGQAAEDRGGAGGLRGPRGPLGLAVRSPLRDLRDGRSPLLPEHRRQAGPLLRAGVPRRAPQRYLPTLRSAGTCVTEQQQQQQQQQQSSFEMTCVLNHGILGRRAAGRGR
eukprot:scaffold1060_cov246-Pinguiococcus_pyrenoidosus.AAC.12